mmetsp:Transcript_28725/g.95399  ORF Transcript_28725/g.95399 Transcript_28725/m.95399 type:complete len:276 (-) Transcript_28725:254-1081(-)
MAVRALLLTGIFLRLAAGDNDLEDGAIAADDECLAKIGTERCALNALQLKAPTSRDVVVGDPDTNFTKVDRRWAMGTLHGAAVMGYEPPPSAAALGYGYMATTTRYGTNPFTACDMDSGALVEGTDYLSVASAQAMQDLFPGGLGACEPGHCRCGKAGPGTGPDSPTAAMGCGTCGRGRFVRQLPRPYTIWTPEDAEIFTKEYNIVVADVCPAWESQNKPWCPATPSETNSFGAHNHLDFAIVPPQYDNFYFAFTPTECSPEMKARIARMSNCHP